MDFFSIGNFLTLGIVGLVLFVYWQLNRHSQTTANVRELGKQIRNDLKKFAEDLMDFVAEKEAAVKDYGITLDVQQKSAKELMRRLQITDEELSHKAAAIAKIDERISAYDTSLEELVRMTVRVQENLNRIQEESAFVESVNKRVGDAKEKILAAEKGLGELERRFKQENAESLEKLAQDLTLDIQSQIAEFRAAVEDIDRRIAYNRDVIQEAEQNRAEQITRDLDIITRTLQEAMEHAVSKADKLEDASLTKLKEQALERIQRLQSAIEEKMKTHQENAKTQVTEFQNQVTAYKETWKNDSAELEVKQRSYKESWKKDIQDLNTQIQSQRETWDVTLEDANNRIKQLSSNVHEISEASKEYLASETAVMEQRLKELQSKTESVVSGLEKQLTKTAEDAERKAMTLTEKRLEHWKQVTAEADANTQQVLSNLEISATEIKTNFIAESAAMEQRLKDLQAHIDDTVAAMEDKMVKTAAETEVKVVEAGTVHVDRVKQAVEAGEIKVQQTIAESEASIAELKLRFTAEKDAVEQQLKDLQGHTDEAITALRNHVMNAAEEAKGKVLADTDAQFDQLKQTVEERNLKTQELLSHLETLSAETEQRLTQGIHSATERLDMFQIKINETASHIEDTLTRAVGNAEGQAVAMANAELERWKHVVEEQDVQSQQRLTEIEASFEETKQHISGETAALTSQVETLQNTIGETSAKIQETMHNAIHSAEKTAIFMANAEREKWNQIVAEEETKTQQRLSDLENSFALTKQHIVDEIADTARQIEALQNTIGETGFRIEEEVATAFGNAENKAVTMANAELERWKQATTEEEAKNRHMLADLETAFSAMKLQVTDAMHAAADQIQVLQNKLSETSSYIEDELAKAVGAAAEKAVSLTDSGLEKWKQAAEEGDTKARTLLAEVERVAAEAHQQTFDEIRSAEERIAAIQNKINEIAAQIEAELAQAVNNAEEKALAMTDSGLKRWQHAAEEGDTKARALFVELEIISSETKKHTFDEIAAAKGQLDTIKNQIAETASHVEAEMAQAVNNAEEKALGLTGIGLEKWHSAIEEREAKAQALLGDLHAAMAELENNMAAMEQHSAKIISDTEKKTLEDAQHQLERWQQAASDEDAKIRQFLADLDAASAETRTRLVSENADIEQRIKDLEIYAEGAMGAFKLQVEKRVKDAEQETIETVNSQVEKWKREASEKDAHIQQFLMDLETATVNKKQHISDEITAVEERLAPLEKRIDEATALVNQEMTNILRNVEKTALILADEEREKWTQAVSDEDAKIRQMFADVEASFAGTRQHLLDEITEAEDKISHLQHKIEETSTHIEGELVKAVGSAEENALVLAHTELEKWKQASEAENSKIMELLSKVTHVFDESETKVADLKERLAVITQDAEQKIVQVTDEQVENWKDITAEAETNTRQLLTDLEAAATEIRTHFTAENSTLEQRLQEVQAYTEHLMEDLKTQVETIARNTEQKTLENMDGQLEKWNELVEGEDLKVRQIIADLETSFSETKKHVTDTLTATEAEFGTLQSRINEAAATIEEVFSKAMEHAEEKALTMADTRYETWNTAIEEKDAKAQNLLASLEATSADLEKNILSETSTMEQRLKDVQAYTADMIAKFEQKVLEETDAKFGEYQAVQAEQMKRLETLADDTSGLDAELRQYMEAIQNRVRNDFSVFEQDAVQVRETMITEFAEAIKALKASIEAVEQELTSLRTKAYENVSQKFRGFEDDFTIDLTKRSEDIDRRLAEWQDALNSKLSSLVEQTKTQYQNTEQSFTEELRFKFTEQHERLVSELEHLKSETSNFEEGIRSQMKVADDSLTSFKEQVHQDMEEARNTAEASVKAELGRYNLSMADTLKQNQRDMETQLKKISDQVESRNNEITGLFNASRQELDQWQLAFTGELQTLDNSINETRRRSQELITESDERLSSIRSAMKDINEEAANHRLELFSHIDEQGKTLDSAIKEADRQLKEFIAQTKLFERTDELKLELERRMEDLRGDFDRIDQRRVEAADLEGQFVKIKRLEDEVNAKMTRFLSEKHRIEQMETEFNRLLQVSTAVEEKLTEVSGADDTLQAIQIQIRRLNDALTNTEEKYLRIEKKNQTLDITNDGIDRNFKSLQESEKVARYLTDEVTRISEETKTLHIGIQALAEENRRAKETADKLSLLDTSLTSIEERIEEMQKARQWLARAETRLEDLNKQSQEQVKLMGTLRKDGSKTTVEDRGAPPIGVRENIIKLAKMGWNVDEIARAVKCGKGEVELILEIMPKE